jgi:hypothetical protein
MQQQRRNPLHPLQEEVNLLPWRVLGPPRQQIHSAENAGVMNLERMCSRRGVVIIVFMFISRLKWTLDQDEGESTDWSKEAFLLE